MALAFLSTIFFAGGVVAILYSAGALFSTLNHARALKNLFDDFEPKAGESGSDGPPVAEAFWERAKILLQNDRFDPALADCKSALKINPYHAGAISLWKRLVQPEPVPDVPAVEVIHPDESYEPDEGIATDEVAVETEPEVAEPAVELQAEAEIKPAETAAQAEGIATDEVAVETEPEVTEPAVELQAEAEIKPAETAAPDEGIATDEVAVETEQEVAEPAVELQAEAEIEPAETTAVETTEEIKPEIPLVRKPLPGDEEETPLIPEDKLVPHEVQRESLLEEYDFDKLKEFEEGEPDEEDAEWIRYADRKGPKPVKSKINLNELPAEAAGLKETLSKLQQAETFNFKGETNLSKNFYNNAIEDFSRALEINPNYVDALINRGSAYAELGRFNDALMDFNRALKFEKRDAELFNKRGEVFLQNKMFNEAIKDFASALVLNPMSSDAYLNRGRAYSEKGMPEEAMIDFKQAVKADSDHSLSFIDRAAPEAHITGDKSSNREEAAKFNQLGSADLQNDKFQDAVENFTKAISLASSEAEGYINRGRALLKLDKPDEALADFNEAVLFDPLNPALYYWRAQAWGAKDNQLNLKEDLKLSCEMGHEPACLKYRELKSTRKYPLI